MWRLWVLGIAIGCGAPEPDAVPDAGDRSIDVTISVQGEDAPEIWIDGVETDRFERTYPAIEVLPVSVAVELRSGALSLDDTLLHPLLDARNCSLADTGAVIGVRAILCAQPHGELRFAGINVELD